MGSVVIAAHNEALVIARCLLALSPAVLAGDLDVIVVCNGCVDSTADIARSFTGVRVVEIAVASKTAALRAGDVIARRGPRIYLDADVVMTSRAALDVMAELSHGPALGGRPPVRFETAGSEWAVQSWYRIRVQLPSIQNVLWGAGTYALSTAGRARFTEFPNIVSDDLFIDNLIGTDERVIVSTDPVIVHAPRRSVDLVKILKRTYRTQSDVPLTARATPVSASQRGQLADVWALVRADPRQICDVVLYVAMITLARVQAKLAPAGTRWERDTSSRETLLPGAKITPAN
ncbi:glycosyltransferase [Cryobacterium sp. CG_9.6]|uniref:glycosyltransferase n=1 Tax=Cryobacterium sp. CG_9.6 TaxID=2760710 RepID=UPI002474C4FE|nr:glycosyltransferase [Cryobacterium sp. CG_9.6]MDH6238271.1 glycosyltransferase involved in cell wall biosynthesis [Cryobacterium sp. CG_9.6]